MEEKIIHDHINYNGKEVIKGFKVGENVRAIDILKEFLDPPDDGIVSVSETYIGLCNKKQSQKWHPEGDVLNHIYNGLMFLEHTPMLSAIPFQVKRLLETIWIYHDIGKVQYPGPKYIGHDKAGVEVLDKIIPDSEFDKMFLFKKWKRDGKNICSLPYEKGGERQKENSAYCGSSKSWVKDQSFLEK